MKYLVAVALIVAGCGSSRPASPDGGLPAADATDAAHDAASLDDAPIDAPADGSIDALPDAMPDAGCPAAGAEQVISPGTPPLTGGMTIVGNGTSSLATWDVSGHTAWAQYDGGGLVAAGETSWFDHSRLYAVGSRVVAYAGDSINVFDAGVWTKYPFPAISLATSGSSFIGVYPVGLHGAEARIFNGTTVLGPTMITSHDAEVVAGDGQGGFAVVTADTSNSSGVQHALMTFDGVSWSSEAPIGTFETATSSARGMALFPFNGSWALVFVLDDELNVMTDAGGTWTRTQTPLQVASTGSSQYVFAVNGTSIAVLDNRGLVGVYKNGTWAQHTLTSTTTYESQPVLRAFGAGFVAVYGGQVGLRAAVYDGTSWGSEVLLAAQTAPQFSQLAASADSAVVGFVEHTATDDVPEVRTFHNGSWGAAVTVGSGQSRARPAPPLAVEADGIRTAYIEPGTAETMVESAGSWAMPEQPPSPPISGEVVAAAMAHAGNGHTLALWSQVVAEEYGVFAAEHDGTSWGPPVLVATGTDNGAPSVAANASTFIIGWGTLSGSGRVARWTGTGIGPVTSVISQPWLASDGSSFVALWSDQFHAVTPHLYSMSSANGDTWSGSTTFANAEASIPVLTGGPAGVLAVTIDGDQVQARLWRGGSWSLANALTGWNYICRGAVGMSDAIAICNVSGAQSSLELAVNTNGTWTYPTATISAPAYYSDMLTTDGSDYRFDIGSFSTAASSVLHAGTWSSAVTDPGMGVPDVVAATCGHWTGVVGSNVITATGAGAYAVDHPTGLPASAKIVPGPERLDAFWVAPTSTSHAQAVLHAQLGL